VGVAVDEAPAAREQGIAFRPTKPLDLPPEIDVLWFILGPVTCRSSLAEGWIADPTARPPK